MNLDYFLRFGQTEVNTNRRGYDTVSTHMDIDLVKNTIKNFFAQTLYVDNKNGNNANTGSKSNPLKTLQEAFNRIPVGGRAVINIIGDYNIGTGVISTGDGKEIFIQLPLNSQLRNECYIESHGYNGYGTIIIGGGTFVRLFGSYGNARVDQFYQPPLKDSSKRLVPTRQGMFGLTSTSNKPSGVTFEFRNRANVTFMRIDAGNFIYRSNWSADRGSSYHVGFYGHYAGKIQVKDGNLINMDTMTGSITWSVSGIGIINKDGKGIPFKNVVTGINRDSNGVVQNVTHRGNL